MSAALRITAAEGIPLLYVLTARLAADAGIPLLAIKGTTLSHHELRAPKVSADVDVLLDPADLDRFVAIMVEAGWRLTAASSVPKILGQHAVSLLNDHWPIGIDLHTFFPGFLASPEEVFAELWRRREVLETLGHPVQITDLAGSAAIAALHHLREPERSDNLAAMDLLVEKATDRFSPDDVADFVALAQATGAVLPLTPFLSRLGARATPLHPREETEFPRWQLGTSTHTYAAWWYVLPTVPWRERPRFLWRLVFLTEAEMRAYYDDRDATTPVWKLHLHRFGRLARSLRPALSHEIARRRRRT